MMGNWKGSTFSFEALCQWKHPIHTKNYLLLIVLLSFAKDLRVAMETSEHAEIKQSLSRSYLSDSSYIYIFSFPKQMINNSKVANLSLQLVIHVSLIENVGEKSFFIFLW